jgi:hypothetical protein
MKKCSAVIYHVLPLLGSIAATNLRRNAIETLSASNPVSAGIGTANGKGRSNSNKVWTNPANHHEALPEYKLTLHNYKGVQYFAPITFNDQKLSAVYDTGSFEVMAMSSMCAACRVPPPQMKYDNRSSSTFVKGGGSLQDHYFAGGLVQARRDLETVHIGDLGKALTVKSMPFWQVVHTDMTIWMSNKAQFTAIVGLGPKNMVPQTQTQLGEEPVVTLLERTGIDRFAICLERGPSKPGHITFNPRFVPPSSTQFSATSESQAGSAVSSMFRHVPLIGKNHWAVKLNEVSFFNGKSMERLCQSANSCVAVIDSGTSLLGVPTSASPVVRNLIKNIKGDCSNIDELPDLSIDLGGHRLALPPEAYIIRFRTSLDTKAKCLPAFTDFDMVSGHGDVWILGMPFLRHFYTVFDRHEPSIYIADQGDNCEPIVHNSTANTTLLKVKMPRPHQEPPIADISEATLPSWATARSTLEI